MIREWGDQTDDTLQEPRAVSGEESQLMNLLKDLLL
jgi:hypothetical protein